MAVSCSGNLLLLLGLSLLAASMPRGVASGWREEWEGKFLSLKEPQQEKKGQHMSGQSRKPAVYYLCLSLVSSMESLPE